MAEELMNNNNNINHKVFFLKMKTKLHKEKVIFYILVPLQRDTSMILTKKNKSRSTRLFFCNIQEITLTTKKKKRERERENKFQKVKSMRPMRYPQTYFTKMGTIFVHRKKKKRKPHSDKKPLYILLIADSNTERTVNNR